MTKMILIAYVFEILKRNNRLIIADLKTNTRKTLGAQWSITTLSKNVTFARKLLRKHYLFDTLLKTSTQILSLFLTTLSRLFLFIDNYQISLTDFLSLELK